MSGGRRIYDVSPELSPEIPVWPGDTRFQARRVASLAEGEGVNLGALETTPHAGAHADAPFHLDEDGLRIGSVDLRPYLGACRLVEVLATDRVHAEDLAGRIDGAERVLVRTRARRVRDPFHEGFASLDPGAAELLGGKGVLLVGLDTPSVDDFASEALPVHRILFRWGVAILEGLDLAGVPEGDYELIALPLRLRGLDASPVRAVLREW